MKGAKERCDSAVQATEQAVAETGLLLPQYQQQMIYARRCAHPGTTFDADGDGRRPRKEA